MLQIWRITPSQNIKIHIDAASLDDVTRQLPEGYYSTFRTYAGGRRVLGLNAHLRRLYEPVATPEVDSSLLRRQLSALLEPSRPAEARVRAVMTAQGQVYLAIAPLVPLPREIYEKGVHVETTELQREHPRLKSTSFINTSDPQRKHIAEEGIFEALLVKNGNILEGLTCNFFYVERDARERRAKQRQSLKRDIQPYMGTARDDILLGVTRETVIELARGRGLEVKEQPLERSRLGDLSEAFITSSSRGIVPVVQIDKITIGQGRPGPITKELMAAYDSYVMEKAEEI